MPAISVIIPAYNAEDYIDDCLASVENQSLIDLEIIVIDDGSTDSTVEHINFHRSHDDRIKLVKQENQFAGVARNRGISVAGGDFLYFLDADDWIETDTLETLFNAASDYSADIVVARSEGFDNSNGSTWLIDYALNGVPFDTVLHVRDYADRLFQSFMGWPWDKLYRKDFVIGNDLSFQPLRTTNDALFVFSSLMLDPSVVCCNKVLFHHRSNNAKSLEGSRNKSWYCAIEAMEAIENVIKSSQYFEEIYKSYCNWVMNYSFWSISTLSPDIAEMYIESLSCITSTMPSDNQLYPNLHERLFREHCEDNRAQLLTALVPALECCDSSGRRISELENELNLCQARLDQTRDQLNSCTRELQSRDLKISEIYDSHSYKLGNLFMKPLSSLKSRKD